MENQLCQQAEKPQGLELQQLKDLLNVQGSNGNWNYDPYMHGMYNGMELALSLLENREANFKEAPSIWLSDMPLGKLLGDPETASQ